MSQKRNASQLAIIRKSMGFFLPAGASDRYNFAVSEGYGRTLERVREARRHFAFELRSLHASVKYLSPKTM